MIYRIPEVMRDIRVSIDQNNRSEQLLDTGDVDTLTLDEIIRSKIVEAVERVHREAPAHLLEEGHNFGDELYWGDQESGWVMLPDDFMRLIVFEMSDWERGVYRAIGTGDREYELQRQRVKALRGTAQKPVCVIAERPEGKVLEFYSCKSERAYVRRGQYLPYPRIDKGDGIDICKRCYGAVVYMAAALTLSAIGESEKAARFVELSNGYLL